MGIKRIEGVCHHTRQESSFKNFFSNFLTVHVYFSFDLKTNSFRALDLQSVEKACLCLGVTRPRAAPEENQGVVDHDSD